MKFIDLPPIIQDIIFSDENVDKSKEIAKEFDLTAEQFDKLFSTIISISSKEISVDQLLPKLKEVGLEEKKTKQLAIKMIGLYLLPLAKFIGGDLVKQLQDLGGKIEDYQPQLKQGQEIEVQNAKRKAQNKEENLDKGETKKEKETTEKTTSINPERPEENPNKKSDAFDIEAEVKDVKITSTKSEPLADKEKISMEDLTNEVIDQIEK